MCISLVNSEDLTLTFNFPENRSYNNPQEFLNLGTQYLNSSGKNYLSYSQINYTTLNYIKIKEYAFTKTCWNSPCNNGRQTLNLTSFPSSFYRPYYLNWALNKSLGGLTFEKGSTEGGNYGGQLNFDFILDETYYFNSVIPIILSSAQFEGGGGTGFYLCLGTKQEITYCQWDDAPDYSQNESFIYSNFTGFVNRIVISYYEGTESFASISSLSFVNGTFSTLSNNNLPYINFTAKTDYCYNTSRNPLMNYTYYLNQSSYDVEGDLIYYSLNPADYSNSYISEKTIFQVSETDTTFNWDFFHNNNFFHYNTTFIADNMFTQGLFALGYYNLMNIPAMTILPYTQSVLFTKNPEMIFDTNVLAMGQGSEWSFGIKNILNTESTISNTIIISQENVKFDYLLLSSLGEIISNLTIYQFDKDYFYMYNGSNLILNASIPYRTTLRLESTFYPDTNEVITKLINLTIDGDSNTFIVFNETIREDLFIKYLHYYTYETDLSTNKNWLLNTITILKSVPEVNRDWHLISSLPYENQMNTLSNSLTLFISDEVHKDLNEFKSYKLTFNIQDCKFSDPNILPIVVPEGQENNYSNDFRPDKVIFKDTIGPSFRFFYSSMGWQNLAFTALWFVFLILLVGLLIYQYTSMQILDFSMPLLVSSFSCMITAIFTGNLTQIISFLVIFGFSLALPFAKTFIGEGGKQ